MKMLIASGHISSELNKRKLLVEQVVKRGVHLTLAGYEKDVRDACAKAGASYTCIPMERTGLNPLSDVKTLWHFYKLIKRERYDVVHSYTVKPNLYSAIAARLAGVKEIYPTVNGLGYAFTGNDLKTKLIRTYICFMYKLAFSCARKVFIQNQDDADELVRRHVLPREKCVVIAGSGIDLEQYPMQEQRNKNTFLMATRLLATKGVWTYVEAAKVVKQKHPEVVFQLAGGYDPNPDGIQEPDLQPVIADGTIEYLGHVNNMAEALAECTVFVLPSYYREGVPHAILEAMSTGRAVLTTDAPGCKETVNGKNGFLIQPKNADQLAERMIWMIEHPEETEKMGLESRKYAQERFDVTIVNGMMMEQMQI